MIKYLYNFRKILLVILFCLIMTSCQIELPSNNIASDNDQSENISVGKAIEAEYKGLKAGYITEHTRWSFTGIVLDMSKTSYNSKYSNYEVKLILDVDGVYIGIYNGFVNGTYPTDITGLEVGVEVSVTGTIAEDYTLSSGVYFAEIEFSKPEISWKKENTNTQPEENDFDGLVNFVMINDTHGAFDDSSEGNSILRVSSLIEELEEASGDYIKIANGDIFQGTYVSSTLRGLPLVEALNLIDFDAFVIGNHEFDWGLDEIAKYKDGNLTNGEANFPFLGANIYYKNTTTRPDWIEPYTIIDYKVNNIDVKVGIIGVIGGTQESSILSSNVTDYTFVDDPTDIIKTYSKELRTTKGCDVVVVATHDDNDYLNTKLSSLDKDSEIDAIFCAHTHKLFNKTITRTDGYLIPIVQNKDKNETAQCVSIALKDNDVVSATSKSLYVNKYEKDLDLINLYNHYLPMIEESNRVLGTTKYSINKYTLGSYAITAMTEHNYKITGYSNIALSIINTGGVRATIEAGEITVSNVFEVFPFDNKVYLVNIKGMYLESLPTDDYLYTYGNQSFNSSEIYTIAVIDFVYQKSDYYYSIFRYAESTYDTGLVMRDLVIDYIDGYYN